MSTTTTAPPENRNAVINTVTNTGYMADMLEIHTNPSPSPSTSQKFLEFLEDLVTLSESDSSFISSSWEPEWRTEEQWFADTELDVTSNYIYPESDGDEKEDYEECDEYEDSEKEQWIKYRDHMVWDDKWDDRENRVGMREWLRVREEEKPRDAEGVVRELSDVENKVREGKVEVVVDAEWDAYASDLERIRFGKVDERPFWRRKMEGRGRSLAEVLGEEY